MKSIIDIKNLTKYYGNNLGIENLSLELNEGEIFGFIGPNGAGKSTTIRLIMNLINKTDGTILIDGKENNKNDIDIKKIIGYLPSEVYLYEELTIKELLNYHQSFYNTDYKKRRKYLTDLFKIDEKLKIESLSLGNRKKVGIILALMHNPKILILDEPTSGLDPIMQQIFYDLLLKEKKNGTTILYSTHILNEVSKICDRVGIVKEGHLLTIESIHNLSKKSFTYVTIDSNESDLIEKEFNLEIISKNNNTIKFKNHFNSNELIKKLAKYNINKILIEESTLEDMFLHYYQ